MKLNSTRLFIAVIYIFLINNILMGQASAWGNYEIYTRTTSVNSVSYLTTQLNLPDYQGGYTFKQSGFMYSHEYTLSNLANIVISPNSELNFSFQSAFRVGAALGTNYVDVIPLNYYSNSIKYYTGTIDFFTIDLALDYTFIFENGYAIMPRLQFGLVDIGGTIGILNGGVFNENAIGSIPIVPFCFKPSLIINLGRGTIGLSMYYNTFNFLDYRIAPRELFLNDDRGLQSHDSIVKKYAVQVLFGF